MIITPNGFFVLKPNYKELQNKYTFILEEGFGKNAFKSYHEYFTMVGKGAIVPRIEFKNSNPKSEIKKYPIKVSSNVILSSNQKLVVNYIKNKFNQFIAEDKVPIRTSYTIKMGTGQGKTYIATGLINLFKVKTLYVVHDEKSLLGIESRLKQFLNCSIGVYYGKRKTDGDVVIGIINSLLNASLDFFQFSFYIYDEAHRYLSDKRFNIFNKIGLYSIGLTATPNEYGEEKQKVLSDMLGPILDVTKIKGFEIKEVDFKGIVHVVKYNIKEPVKINNMINVAKTVQSFIDNEELTDLIVQWMINLKERNKSVYIFAETKIYLDHLFFACPFKNKVMLRGKACKEDYEDANNADFIFTTYAFGSDALSIAHMDAIIYATPRKKNDQSSGRILRMDGDVSSLREIVDIVHSCFYKQFEERTIIYKQKGFNIKYL